MLSNHLQSYAQDILSVSEEMYRHAKQGDWMAFTALEVRRQRIIDTLFAHPHIDISLEDLALTLRQVLAIDNKSMVLGEQEKQRLGREMAGQKQHRQAAQVYQLVSMN